MKKQHVYSTIKICLLELLTVTPTGNENYFFSVPPYNVRITFISSRGDYSCNYGVVQFDFAQYGRNNVNNLMVLTLLAIYT